MFQHELEVQFPTGHKHVVRESSFFVVACPQDTSHLHIMNCIGIDSMGRRQYGVLLDWHSKYYHVFGDASDERSLGEGSHFPYDSVALWLVACQVGCFQTH
jgi:hypothetical protein